MEKAIVKDQIEINAPVEKVWKILSHAKYYRQWDDLPENFTNEKLKKGDVIEWPGYSKMTVIESTENEKLKLSLVLPKEELNPADYDISYTYKISKHNGNTILHFEIGDFAPLPDPRKYYDSSVEFVDAAKKKIKDLAENE